MKQKLNTEKVSLHGSFMVEENDEEDDDEVLCLKPNNTTVMNLQ